MQRNKRRAAATAALDNAAKRSKLEDPNSVEYRMKDMPPHLLGNTHKDSKVIIRDKGLVFFGACTSHALFCSMCVNEFFTSRHVSWCMPLGTMCERALC